MKIISALILPFLFVGLSTTKTIKEESNFTNLNNKLILKLVNDARANGCNCGNKYMPAVAPLVWNDVIANASANHSRDMSRKKFFSHNSADGSSLADRFNAVGYKWMAIGENIAVGQRDEYEVMNSWLKVLVIV